jgi:hypothetical protein
VGTTDETGLDGGGRLAGADRGKTELWEELVRVDSLTRSVA